MINKDKMHESGEMKIRTPCFKKNLVDDSDAVNGQNMFEKQILPSTVSTCLKNKYQMPKSLHSLIL